MMRWEESIPSSGVPDQITSSPRSWRSGNSASVATSGGDDALVARDDRRGGADDDVLGVVAVEGRDAAILPDLLGDADDVVGEVGEIRVEPFHAVNPFGLRPNRRRISGPWMRMRRGAVSPSMRERRASTVASTMRFTAGGWW